MAPRDDQGQALTLGLDCGTSLIKAGVYTASGDCVGFASAQAPTLWDGPERATLDPETAWRAALAAVTGAVAQCTAPERIRGIACCSVGEAAILVSRNDRAISPIYAWIDRRGAATCADWVARFGDDLYARTGQPPEPILTAHKLDWIRRNDPGLYRAANAWLTLADYFTLRLSGRRSAERSLACRSGVFGIAKGDWDCAFLDAVGLRTDLFAPLTESGTALGPILPEVARATGLPDTCIAGVGGYDQALGALVCGGFRNDTLSVTMGSTEAQVIPVSGPRSEPALSQAGVCQGMLGYDGVQHRFLLGGIYTAGLALEWLRDTILGEAGYDRIIAAAQAVPPGCDGVRFLPQMLVGSSLNAQIRPNGAFWGLGLSCDRATLYRAVLEGLAFEGRLCGEALAMARGGAIPTRIRSIGGDTKNLLRLQIKAAVSNLPIEVIGLRSAPGLGAAVMAAKAAGCIATVQDGLAALAPPVTRIDPDPELAGVYDAIFETSYRRAAGHLTRLTQIP